ncbi:MAG: (S)-mandelate dehydrogenase, partial [Gammaproteobacteria bacterium]
ANWDTLAQLRDMWPGKLVVKGVLDAQDAMMLRDAGVDAIQVSSHGSRQLDSAPPPITALVDIRQAVGPDFPLFYDTGLRSGEDVVKAFQQGANFTFLGRILQFAIAAAGEEGLAALWDVIKTETSITLAQIGEVSLAP